jgi:hypothetical protein
MSAKTVYLSDTAFRTSGSLKSDTLLSPEPLLGARRHDGKERFSLCHAEGALVVLGDDWDGVSHDFGEKRAVLVDRQPRRSERMPEDIVRPGSSGLSPRLDAAGFAQFEQPAREAG